MDDDRDGCVAAALRIVARTSCPLSRGRPAHARVRDAPPTAGETPAIRRRAVELVLQFPCARQAAGMSDCSRFSSRGMGNRHARMKLAAIRRLPINPSPRSEFLKSK